MNQTLYESLMRASYRFLSYRSRSEKELRDFLEKKLKVWKVAGQSSVNKTMTRLAELGYIDDRKFVAWWVRQRSTFRPKGIRGLKFELMKKGISRELIEEVLSKNTGEEDVFDEYAVAQKAILKKSVLLSHLPTIEQKKRLYTFLAQRGFSSDTIGKIIDGIGKKDYN